MESEAQRAALAAVMTEQGRGLAELSRVIGRNPGPNMHAIATGDFNGDGVSDVAFREGVSGGTASGERRCTSRPGQASLIPSASTAMTTATASIKRPVIESRLPPVNRLKSPNRNAAYGSCL